jgi:transposase
MLITDVWTEQTHQFFLQMVRNHWRGWNIWLYQDRGSPHTTEDSQELALDLGFTLRWLPKACPKLNAMDQLWRRAKAKTVASRPTISVDTSACWLCDYILDLSPSERLRQAGVLSGNFWLAKGW